MASRRKCPSLKLPRLKTSPPESHLILSNLPSSQKRRKKKPKKQKNKTKQNKKTKNKTKNKKKTKTATTTTTTPKTGKAYTSNLTVDLKSVE
jgi:hypothetical protein